VDWTYIRQQSWRAYCTLSEAGECRNRCGASAPPRGQTDVKDAEWIADLLCHGLLRSSFVPPKPIRELRDLTRYRRKLVESQAAERNRLLKLLESANIKLASVARTCLGFPVA
jgi:hypothetical protein